MDFELSDVSEKKFFKIHAMTCRNVVGDMKAVDWQHQGKLYQHLTDVPFEEPVNKGRIDILIGNDHPLLHKSISEIEGEEVGPIARLTPLGWTCIGRTQIPGSFRVRSSFVGKISMFCKDQKELSEINSILKRFWEVEKIEGENTMSSVDKQIVKETTESIRWCSGEKRFQVTIPWNKNKAELVNNYDQAYKRLQNTERQFEKKPELRDTYVEKMQQYLKKTTL